ncbi:PREDICTED: CCAAT/enhancer-binding protein zeta, partial [Gekko japonicus]|uniref:CCAAT/enhancer-binding protein zeta n=1 Tax=Gekko japonicus TaxID=146911 RepID=A0ABM1JR43_GEKJA
MAALEIPNPGECDGFDDDEVPDDGSGFTLQEVLRLGGTQQDYLMLAALDETEELVDGGKKGSIDDLKQGELEAFIKSLGVSRYSEKLLVVEEEGTTVETEGKPQKKVKQKEVNVTAIGKKENQVKESKGKIQLVNAKNSKKHPALCRDEKEKKEEIFQFHERQMLLIKPGGKWYDLEYTNEFTAETQDQSLVSKYMALAEKLYQQETDLYKSKKDLQKRSSSAWMKTVVSSGTLADRMAAMTLLIQDAAVHSLHFIETLVNLIKKKGSRRQSLMALDTFKELLMTHLLPDNRKLHTFSQHPFGILEKLSSGNKDSRDRRLILWYFEHHLKHWVAEFVHVLEALTHDPLVATKARALAVAHELLCNKVEEEKAFLVQLVNKLGDPQNKVATKASYLLETLLHKHPNMKGVVCNEVERLLYRSNISLKAQYYAICFLNQMVLSHEESELANKLIALYFSFFGSCIKKKDVESKMLSALLTGVNRAYPYAQTSDEKVKEQMNTLFKVLHVVNFNTSVQALMLLFQVMDSNQTISDRYYTALYKKLLDPGLALCAKQSMFLNLVYKSLKADTVLRRVKAFVKRLLQVTCSQMPPFTCGTLYLVSELLKLRPGLWVQLQDNVESDDEEHFRDLEETEEEEAKLVNVDKEKEKKRAEESVKLRDSSSRASWVHHQNLAGSKNLNSYDPLHRNPSYCGADRTSLWELKKLSEHFHPSVVLFAKTILEGRYIEYSGDPLQDFTLMRFLDRFVYRNPKGHKGKENTSSVVMQPKKKQSMSNIRNLVVNSKEFLAQDESQIPVDEVFFHRFYKRLDMEKEKKTPVRDDESVEDVDDDEFERALDSFEQDSYFDTIGKEDLNFAGNVKSSSDKKSQSDEADWEDSDEDDFDDEEVSLSMDEDVGEDLDEEGGTFMDVSDDDNLDETEDQVKPVSSNKGKRTKKMDFAGSLKGPKESRKRKLKDTGMLAAAEEFGYLLDENIGSKFDSIGMHAMANKDNANFKQLKWEAERDRWIHNKDVKSIIRQKKKFQHKPLK